MSCPLDLERTIERGLMLQRALLGRQGQVVVEESEIDPGPLGSLDGV